MAERIPAGSTIAAVLNAVVRDRRTTTRSRSDPAERHLTIPCYRSEIRRHASCCRRHDCRRPPGVGANAHTIHRSNLENVARAVSQSGHRCRDRCGYCMAERAPARSTIAAVLNVVVRDRRSTVTTVQGQGYLTASGYCIPNSSLARNCRRHDCRRPGRVGAFARCIHCSNTVEIASAVTATVHRLR